MFAEGGEHVLHTHNYILLCIHYLFTLSSMKLGNCI